MRPLPAVAVLLALSTSALGADLRHALASADLDYTTPTTRSEEGMPVGNGRMGSLVWTTPSALKFQINRVDVFGMDSSTVSFPRADSDYASDCAYLDINVVSAGEDVFAGNGFHQHLSTYDGLMEARGRGLTARVIGWPKADVMAVEIDDQRDQPEAVSVDLRMLRYAMQGFPHEEYKLMREHVVQVQTANHLAVSRLGIDAAGRISLTQEFRELKYYDSSAVAIAVVGRPSRARYLNDATVQLAAAPGRGRFVILIGSAASFDASKSTAALALAAVDQAAGEGFDALAGETASWWHDFWNEGYVDMASADHQAEFVGGNYLYFLYLMNACSRGAYMPRFGGMLWYTQGDFRRWGSQYWHSNQNALYQDLMTSGHLELMEPFFSTYFGMYDACALAARQQWDSQGIFLPEITFFNGPEPLPDNLVKEFQDLYLVRKPYDQHSQAFQFWIETKNRHNSRYNFLNDGTYVHGHLVVPTKGAGIFGSCTHFLSGAAGIASEFWQKYEFTGDREWLRKEGYPMIRGVAEFYRNFPNVEKGTDGKWHIHHVNRIESDWDSSDTVSELGAMHTVFPLAVEASEALGVDADLRPKWTEIADHLAEPAPGSGNTGTFLHGTSPQRKKDAAKRKRTFSRGSRPYGMFVAGEEGKVAPLGSEPELKAKFLGFDAVGGFVDPDGVGGAQIFRNRLRLREGPGAPDCEHLGGLAFGVHESLLTNEVTPDLAKTSLQVFPAWPKDWDVTFKLLAHGGVVVTAAQRGGKVRYVTLESRLGTRCELANPWGAAPVTVTRNGKPAETLSGATLDLATAKGESITVAPAGA